MKSRKKKSKPVRAKRYARKQKQNQQFEYTNLEPRQLLATDFVGNLVNLGGADGSDLIHLESPVPLSEAADLLRNQLNLGSNESVVLQSTKTDNLGWTHYKYQQHIDGIPVERSSYKLHVYGGEITMLSGDPITVENVVLGTEITPETALQAALDHIGADTYEWEVFSPIGDQILPPQPIPVYLTNVDGESVVAYKMVVRAVEPTFSSDTVFVNANTGEVELVKSTIHNADDFAFATLVTFNQGNFPINDFAVITADTDNGTAFTLENESGSLKLPGFVQGALGGVETRDTQNNNNVFRTDNPIFANTEGSHLHYGAEQSLEYFWDSHFRLSFDDAGARVINNANLAIANAFWDGQSLSFGGGFGAIDVVGHEFSHGVVQFSANLVYQNEYGALNESFADIFGEAVEEHALADQGLGDDQNDWLLGAEVVGRGAFRGFENPNDFGHPKYYQGRNWEFGSFDNGGVHINSSVQNHWFYLLSRGTAEFPGGVYVNEVGERYQFDGIGMENAERIAYRNLNVYLSAFSEFEDARDGAIQASIDMFGRNSDEWHSTRKAWEAVGLYKDRVVIDELSEYIPGSIIYSETGRTAPTNLDPVEIWVNLNDGQTASLVVTPAPFSDINTSVVVETHDFAPNGPHLADDGIVVINEFPITTSGQTVFTIDGTRGRLGKFDYTLVLNSELEIESVGDEVNEVMADAQDITDGVYVVGDANGSAERYAVLGTFERDEVPTVDSDDFESGALDGSWTTTSTEDGGRVQVSDRFGTGVGGGSFALFMDTLSIQPNLNEAIWSVDVSTVATPLLSFGYVEFDDENSILPPVFSHNRVGDGVAVSDDGGATWYTILTDTETVSGEWTEFKIDLAEFATNNNLSLNSNFLIKFQQYDDGQITSGSSTDGRGFDNVRIVSGEPSVDWYSFDATIDEVVSLTVGNPFSNDSLMVELYDSAGNMLQAGAAQPNGTNAVNQYFINASDTYFAKVSGQGEIDYGFFVTRDTEIDTGSTVDSPQNIGVVNSVMGAVAAVATAGADPDAVEDFEPLDNYFGGVTLSDNITGGSVYPALASFDAPTGSKVFATSVSNDDGWQEGVNEFRADFPIGQFSVSLDIGSDDGGNDIGFMRAYDADGVLLGEAFTGSIAPGKKQTLTLTNNRSDIVTIVAGGVGTDVAPVDNLIYEVADEQTDYYTFDLTAGRLLDIDATFPGVPQDFSGFGTLSEGRFPSLFFNRLKFGSNVNLRMELTEVATGIVVAAGEEAINFDVVDSGEYQLKVSSVNGFGNYFIDIDQTLGQLVDVGLMGDGVAISETATGTGYIMFSEDRVHDRFSVAPPNPNNSDHLISVRFNEQTGEWQYNNDTGWFTFGIRANDRILAAVNFNSDTVVSYEGATGSINGIPKGFMRGDLSFAPNVFGGVADTNEVSVGGSFFDTDAAVLIPDGSMNSGIAVADDASGTGFLMYSRESVHTRLAGVAPNADNSDHFIAVRWNGTNWEYNNAQVWTELYRAIGDRLVAAIDFDARTATPLLGATGTVGGMDQGYSDGDLVFTPNMFGGVHNGGEYTVEGTFFEGFEDDAIILSATMGNGIAIADGATGLGYVMFSVESVHTRFDSAAPNVNNSDHLIGVRYTGAKGWEYNNAFTWVKFTPSDSDRLLAEIDLSNRVVTSLQGKSGEVQGVVQGYEEGDLVFHADQWAGGFNRGEYEVTGSFFEARTSQGGLGNLGSGVAVTDRASGNGYFMHSAESVHDRFAADRPNRKAADNLIAVRYDSTNSTWEYNNAQGWFAFTPVATDRLFAAVDFGTMNVQMLEGLSGDIQGITAGYFDTDITVEVNKWDGRFNFGEYTFSGSYLMENSMSDRLVGSTGSGVAIDSAATGDGFILYSAENLFERFSTMPPMAGASHHLIAVRFDKPTSTWQYNDNNQWNDFNIATEDRLLATVDFDTDSVISLQGTNGVFQGSLVGYDSGDLTFTASLGDVTIGGSIFNA